MNELFFQNFTQFLDNKWFKRLSIMGNIFINLEELKTIRTVARIQKIEKKSKLVANFLDIASDISEFNIQKMNPNGLVIKSLEKNQKIFSFLNNNSNYIERGISYLKKLGNSKKQIPSFFNKLVKSTKYVSAVFEVVDIGSKAYKNYKETKSIGKTIIGTCIDKLEEFTFLDGIVYGSFLGAPGMAVGFLIGGGIQLVNFIDPNFFGSLKKQAFNIYDKIFQKPTGTTDVFIINKDVIIERINFYQQLVARIALLITSLERFFNNFDEYSSGKTAKINKAIFIRMLNNIKKLQEEYFKPTLNDLKQQNLNTASLFQKNQQLEAKKFNVVEICYNECSCTLKNINAMLKVCQQLYSQINIKDSNLQEVRMRLSATLNNWENKKRTLTQLLYDVDRLENSHYYE